MAERVQKILAQWGIASRRRAEEMIVAGRVRRNGKIVQLGEKADPSASLRVNGEPNVKTIWLGLGRLHDISETWKLSHQISSPIEPP
jgi:16S rRNA U516 pseudouridylate synthase RsuA-like enzyme